MMALLLASALTALQATLDASAEWTMERQFAQSTRLVRSSGTVTCHPTRGLVWSVDKPFVSSVAMTTNAMVFSDEEGVRVRALDDLPHYADIVRAADRLRAGDTNALERAFALTCREQSDGGWQLRLVPTIGALAELVQEIELNGAALPTNAVLRSRGAVSRITFRPRNHD